MKVKKYLLIIALVLTIGISHAGSAFACSGGGSLPPPDTNSSPVESPAT